MPHKKRSHGEGSLNKRADGRYSYELMRDRKRYIVYGKTMREAQQKGAELRRQLDRGIEVEHRMSVAQFLERWLTEVIEPERKPGTVRAYRQAVTRFLIPRLGPTPLAQLSPLRIQTLKRQLLGAGLADSYVRLVLATLSSALDTAEKWRLLDRNPAAVVDKPAQGKRIVAIDIAQAAAIARAFRGHRYEAAVRLGMELGLRAGEVIALRWQDVDLLAGTVAVSGQHERPLDAAGGPRLVRAEVKPGRPRPELPLSPQLVAILQAQRARQAEEQETARLAELPWHDTGLVVTKVDGTGIWTQTLRATLERTLRRHELPVLTFHALRHAASTVMHAQGVSAETRAEILGHTTPRLTAEVYTYVQRQAMRAAVEGVAAALDEPITVRITVNGPQTTKEEC